MLGAPRSRADADVGVTATLRRVRRPEIRSRLDSDIKGDIIETEWKGSRKDGPLAMPKKDRYTRLAKLKANRKNRTFEEIQDLHKDFGFERRKNTWQKGSFTQTLHKPHGRDPVMLIPYVLQVIRSIEASEAEANASQQKGEGSSDE